MSSRVLEIGVGTGRIALPLSEHVGAYFGVDISRPMMARLQAKRTSQPIYLVEANAARLPFVTDVFDAAIAVHVFHLIPGWRAVLDELARVLRPGAPLLYCWTDPETVFKTLWDAWKSAIPASSTDDLGIRFDRDPIHLIEAGWKLTEDVHTYTFTVGATPQQFVERLHNRIWSQTWRLSDDDLAKGVAAVKEIIRNEFPDPHVTISVTSAFHVRAYLPPRLASSWESG